MACSVAPVPVAAMMMAMVKARKVGRSEAPRQWQQRIAHKIRLQVVQHARIARRGQNSLRCLLLKSPAQWPARWFFECARNFAESECPGRRRISTLEFPSCGLHLESGTMSGETSSWDNYVSQLTDDLGFKDVCMMGKDGTVWASTAGFTVCTRSPEPRS